MGIYMRMRIYEILFTSTLSVIYILDLSSLRFKYLNVGFLFYFTSRFLLTLLSWLLSQLNMQERKNLLISQCCVGEAETPILIMYNIFLTLEILIKDKQWEEIGWYVQQADTRMAGWTQTTKQNLVFSWQFKYSYSSDCGGCLLGYSGSINDYMCSPPSDPGLDCKQKRDHQLWKVLYHLYELS